MHSRRPDGHSQSPHGHDAFLIETARARSAVCGFPIRRSPPSRMPAGWCREERMRVLKFGGTSVATAERIAEAAAIVVERGGRRQGRGRGSALAGVTDRS